VGHIWNCCKIDRNKLLRLKAKGEKVTALAKEMNISRASVYKILKEEGGSHTLS